MLIAAARQAFEKLDAHEQHECAHSHSASALLAAAATRLLVACNVQESNRYLSSFPNQFLLFFVGQMPLLEEPDFATGMPASGDAADWQVINQVNDAILRMYSSVGIDPYMGRKLTLAFSGAASGRNNSCNRPSPR